ncbi:FtsX-like permease family protein [Massilia endophytica]|uniref:FtsX-like permease family protein n=1 Tax=Massilia endophytica TaxID=2899220 RepID=UPI001E42EBA3|nr:FtsX-like permease family protein [Massilia endophytica]UGQ45433.1 ABC transporter permease [Massilia endophytica]
MKLRDFRFGWRMLAGEPVYSLVVLGGLSIGLAAALLLFSYVRYSWGYNAQVPDVDRVYVIKQRYNVDSLSPWFDQAPLFLREVAAATPGVEAATAYLPARPDAMGLTVRVGAQLSRLNGLTVLPGFATMLGLRTVRGDLEEALAKPEGIAVTEAAARRLFGTVDAQGATMQVEGKLLQVMAIVETPASNTTVPFEMLTGVNSLIVDEEVRKQIVTGEQGWWGKLLVRTRPDAPLQPVADALQAAVDRHPSQHTHPPEVMQRLAGRKVLDVVLSPLREAYFDQQVGGNYISQPGPRGNRAVVAGLGAVGLLILVLAAINYANLAAVRLLRRQREIAMRKVLGASVRQIVLQLLAESMLVAMFAAVSGLLLAWAASPVFARLMDRELESMLTPWNLGLALALGLLLGAATAIYPAWLALRVRPAQALAGKADAEMAHSASLRRSLTVFQTAAAMGLAGVTMAVVWQTAFALKASPGFDPSRLLIVDLPEAVRYSKTAQGFMAALRAQPGIEGVAISEDAVGRQKTSWVRDLKRPGGASAVMDMKSVSANFFTLYGVAPLAGRLFDASLDKEDDAVPLILNAMAARELGFSSPAEALGQTLLFTGFDNKVVHKRVIGIAPDLRFRSLRDAPRATAYELWTAGATLTVRAASLPDAERTVRGLWPGYFPNAMPSIQPAAAIQQANYDEEARVSRLLAAASCVALGIAAFGSYVMAARSVQRRAKEFVLRKLHGARRRDIGLLLARDFGALVLMAAVLALPLAALGIERYLAGYVERAPVGWWTIAGALAATALVVCMAVVRHAILAMQAKPADALRL